MRLTRSLFAALLAASLFTSSALVRGDDDKSKTDKTDTKTAEKPAATEVTTQGSIDVGGQHISVARSLDGRANRCAHARDRGAQRAR